MGAPNRKFVWVLACAVSAGAGLARADWPQWRGANRDAKVTGFVAPATWPKSLTQKWKTQVGDGVATPALVGDKLYVFSREDGNEVTRCLEADTGKELWRDKYPSLPAQGPAAQFSGPRSSPAVADGKVVTQGLHGTVSCLDAATGKKLWRKDDFPGETPRFYTASSPLITGGLCIAQVGGPGNGGIIAYDLNTGDTKWKWTGDGPGYASPALMMVGDTPLVIAETDRNVVALNASDGKQVWETPFAAQGMGAYNAATPVIEGDTLIFSGGGRGTRAVKLAKGDSGITGADVWTNADKSVQFSSPVVKDNLLYGLSQSNELFCLDLKDGKTLWTTSLGGAAGGGGGMRPPGGGPGAGPGGPGGPGGAGAPGGRPRGGGGRRMGGGGRGGYGSLVDAGTVLFALTPSSDLVAFQPSDKQYTEIAKIKVADSPTYAYPVISGDQIFIKDQQSLTSLSLK
ncbi:MAG TPA: PQQ-binding-like beta-propeller repeat protein [Tepidisphaeraceae bacterium]|nr:PQQ-binding-like beta-propeller repeat protein [Tepidisphaeraceae bacterium]